MKVSITLGLDKQTAAGIVQDFKSAKLLRKRLQKLIDDKKEEAVATAYAKASYEIPNWPYVQADRVGYIRALKEIVDLLDD